MATDTFNGGVDGDNLSVYSANWGTLGSAANNQNKILTNAVQTTGQSANRWVGRTWLADQYSKITIVSVGATGAKAVCVRGEATSYTAYHGGSSFSNYAHLRYAIWKRVAGTFTSLVVHGSQTMLDSDIVKLSVVGTELTLNVNGTDILGPTSDASIASGEPGMFIVGTASVVYMDDWEGDDIITATPITGLGRRHQGFIYGRP